MSELLYLNQTFTGCVNSDTVKMTDVTASYGIPPNFITFFAKLTNTHKIEHKSKLK